MGTSLLPNVHGHLMCLRIPMRTGCVEEICCVQLLRTQLSFMPLSSPCREHEYDEATPTSDLWDAVLTFGQPSKHSTALVLQFLTWFNSPNGGPTVGVTTLSLVPAYTSLDFRCQMRLNRRPIHQVPGLHFMLPRPRLPLPSHSSQTL
jgi:hypothetical protein